MRVTYSGVRNAPRSPGTNQQHAASGVVDSLLADSNLNINNGQ